MTDTPKSTTNDLSPSVEPTRAGRAKPPEGIGLCLSGGGYRAMLFHAGVLWRLNEMGMLPKLSRISSVSGGSITAGVLGLKWKSLRFNATGTASNFDEEVVAPIRRLAGQTLDAWAIGLGALNPFASISEEVQDAYRKHLFGEATLQELPENPRFVINATNIQSGALFRFSKKYMGDYRIGLVMSPTVSLATAVAASSAFPPVLSPATLKVSPTSFAPPDPDEAPPDLTDPAFRSRIVLSDGGVYDNLGLEAVWKRCETILVSDAGQKISDEPSPAEDWARHAIRVLDVVDNQVRSLRKRMLIAAFQEKLKGAYWGIRTDIANYGLRNALPCPHARTLKLAATPTRLATIEARLQEQLINWGYAVCDAGIRAHVLKDAKAPSDFPYGAAAV
jgi:NTE family protein